MVWGRFIGSKTIEAELNGGGTRTFGRREECRHQHRFASHA